MSKAYFGLAAGPLAIGSAPPVSYDFWRVLFDGAQNNGDGYLEIAEIELRQVAGVAENMNPWRSSVQDSGSFLGSTTGQQAFDGNKDSVWLNNGSFSGNPVTTPAWVSIKFDTSHDIKELMLRSPDNGEYNRMPVSFKLQYSTNNGTTWTTKQSWTTSNWTQNTIRTFAV